MFASWNKTPLNLEKEFLSFSKKGITELFIYDTNLASNRERIIHLLDVARKEIPNVFISITVNIDVLDNEVIKKCKNLFCSLEIFMCNTQSKTPLVDKKLFTKKILLLNNAGLVYGFFIDYALIPKDTLKLFMARLDFAFSLYPNHINFIQLENSGAKKIEDSLKEKCTQTFSSKDILYAKNIALAINIFYSQGRAVPWFLSVLTPLKISAPHFFADFAEWEICNNYKLNDTKSILHKEIEKMQISFLQMKYEEKNLMYLFPIVFDLVQFYGALSRVEEEGEECEIKTSYNPNDIVSPCALDVKSFTENTCMEECRVKIFAGNECPNYKIIL